MPMEKYTKRSLEIEAQQFLPHSQHKDRWPPGVMENGRGGWEMETLEGWYVVIDKDYIIRGIRGELYPCKPDIFYSTYAKG